MGNSDGRLKISSKDTSSDDMSLADNGTAYLGGMGSDDNLGVVKLSSNYPFYWYEATGWNFTTLCGYPDCAKEAPIMKLEEGILACVFILGLRRYKKKRIMVKITQQIQR